MIFIDHSCARTPPTNITFHGALVHTDWIDHQHRDRLPGHGLRQHHGLCAGAVRILYRAAVWHRTAWHVVEASYTLGRISGIAGRHRLIGDDVFIDAEGGSAEMGTDFCAVAIGKGP